VSQAGALQLEAEARFHGDLVIAPALAVFEQRRACSVASVSFGERVAEWQPWPVTT
jgi:hypothetical protein